jgi:hypothetical protein
MATRQTSSRRALHQNTARPWEAPEDAIRLVPELPIIPKAPQAAPRTGQRPAYVTPEPPPPPVPDEDSQPRRITSSLRAPEDVKLVEEVLLGEPTVPMGPPRRHALSTELVKETFAQRRYGPARYRLHIEESKSGAGGLPGQQPLMLIARKEPVPSIFCGWVDPAQGEAQLRSYGVVSHRYERRHGEPPPLSEEEYDRFLDRLMDALFDAGFQILHLVSNEEELRPSGWRGRFLRRSFLTGLGVTLLTMGAFALGLNAAHLVPWLVQHVPTWLSLTGSIIEQGISWFEAARHLLA